MFIILIYLFIIVYVISLYLNLVLDELYYKIMNIFIYYFEKRIKRSFYYKNDIIVN